MGPGSPDERLSCLDDALMCGIVGFCGLVDPAQFEAACKAMAHRDPDDAGIYHDEAYRIALGHRRLSILDLSPLGK